MARGLSGRRYADSSGTMRHRGLWVGGRRDNDGWSGWGLVVLRLCVLDGMVSTEILDSVPCSLRSDVLNQATMRSRMEYLEQKFRSGPWKTHRWERTRVLGLFLYNAAQ